MNKLYVLPVGRNRKWEVITQNVLRGASGPRKQKIHRAQSSAKGWFVWTRWMYAKFMCSNHTNHTSYNHSHSRVNSRSRFEVSVRISWSKVCVFGRHWQATTINNGFAIRFSSVLKIFTSFFLEMRYCSFLLTFRELSVYLRAFSPFLSCWFHVWRISCPSFAHESLRLSLFCQNILFFLVLFEGRDRRYWCNVQMKIIWKKHFSLLLLSPGIKICAVYKVAKSFRLGMGSLAVKVCCHSAVYPLDQLNSIWNSVFLF